MVLRENIVIAVCLRDPVLALISSSFDTHIRFLVYDFVLPSCGYSPQRSHGSRRVQSPRPRVIGG